MYNIGSQDWGSQMEFTCGVGEAADEIIALFEAAFSAAEGPDEGRMIATLVKNLLSTTRDGDLFVMSAYEEGRLAGCICFSRLSFAQDKRTVFILSPVAVAPGRQGEGVGQALLTFGLGTLREQGIDAAVTYGDPAYYSKVGFSPIDERVAKAPLAMTQPEGWLAMSLTDRPLDPLKGPSRCVEALNDPVYW